MGGSSHNNILTAYYQTIGSVTTYVANPTSQLGGVWMDNNPVPRYPSDALVAEQALESITQFGYDRNGSYVVATPHGRSTQGFGQFCAYHGTAYFSTYTSSDSPVSYTNFPYTPDVGRDCGANFIKPPRGERGIDEGVTILAGHEEAESVTDPIPWTGWADQNQNEIGDDCQWLNIANDRFGNYSFTMQPLFSIATGTCIQSY